MIQTGERSKALEVKYIKALSKFLWSIGAWPGEEFGDSVALPIRFQRLTLPYQCAGILAAQIYYLVNHRTNIRFFDVGHVIINCFLTLATGTRTALPSFKGYTLIVKKFINDFHLIHFKDKGEYDEKVYKITDFVSYYFTIMQMTLMVCGMTLFNMSPLYNDYRMGAFSRHRPPNITMDFAVFYEFPGATQDEHFYAATFLNLWLSWNCSVSVCSIDLLLSLMVFQIIGHIRILMYDFENLERPKSSESVKTEGEESLVPVTVELFDRQENMRVHRKLIDMVIRHRLIVEFADDISSFFGPLLALTYSFHLVSLCILLLECSQNDPQALARFLPLTAIIFGELVQISVVFEVVGYMGEKLIDSVYLSPWECMNVSNQKSMKFILSRIQLPLQVTAMGMVPVGVETMTAIIKTTMSFFAILQSIND
ncbi:hypothetical protein JYU34_000100 [Plutella xylostella]|uniref:Odorant receptor n=2 Tax=Plutella xylostella TaxID=51655 RepID=N0A7R9_PLUXY|nr:odorant receptor 13a-like [Plutella xylostella]AGK43828.1 odorant receptor 6 [Plutella xylostella]KAG7313019.1 hypothetical protein JYU34_000100 [Plutella xylostella]CAG9137424.1 unnamed protein product [Plutella xylostella]